LIVVLGVSLGARLTLPLESLRSAPLLDRLTQGCGRDYASIVADGYSYRPGEHSNVAFFPAYPLLAAVIGATFRVGSQWALLAVSNACFLLALSVLARYCAVRSPTTVAGPIDYTLLLAALFPAGLFFRLAYSESLFLLLAVLSMYGLRRQWPFVVTASIIGLASGTRPVGAALVAPLLISIWNESQGWRQRCLRLLAFSPLAVWGVAAYMLYQYMAFGDPLAFAGAHATWRFREPLPLAEKLLALFTLEPLWSVYDPQSAVYWGTRDRHGLPWFSLTFFNPILLIGAVALTAYGAWRRWLDAAEVSFIALVLAIPYIARSYEMGAGSMGRFVSVAFPLYLVGGRILAGLPVAASAALVVSSAGFLLIFSALFCAGYPIY
jgi:hypothetical protein